MTLRVGVLLFDGVDLLDVGGPYEVLLTANRLAERDGGPAPFEVVTLAAGSAPVTAYGGLGLVAQADLDTLGDPLDPAFDVVVVPGLVDLHRAATDPDLHTAVRRATAGAGIVASVCTGSVLLAHVGLLDDAALATTHHEDVEALAALLGDGRATVARWVDAGDVVTAGGLSSGLAMALHLVDRLVSRDLAVRTAAQIAYDWDPDAGVTA